MANPQLSAESIFNILLNIFNLIINMGMLWQYTKKSAPYSTISPS